MRQIFVTLALVTASGCAEDVAQVREEAGPPADGFAVDRPRSDLSDLADTTLRDAVHADVADTDTAQIDAAPPDSAPPGPNPTSFIYVAKAAVPSAGVGAPKASNGPAPTLAAARAAPMPSIVSAVTKAKGGTAIVVRGGSPAKPEVYAGTIVLNAKSTTSASAQAPIWIVSETYRGARIVSTKDDDGVRLSGARHVALHNFQIEKLGAGPDHAPVKIIGNGKSSLVNRGHLVIAGNLLYGSGTDGIKATTSLDLRFYGNTIDGSGGGFAEAGIDFVSVFDSELRHNTITGPFKIGFVPKGGSMNLLFELNDVSIVSTPAVVIGGQGSSRTSRPMPFDGRVWEWAEAHDVIVRHNLLETTGSTAMRFKGSRDVLLEGNYLAAKSTAARSVLAPSGSWSDQPQIVPPLHAPFVEVNPSSVTQRFVYHPRHNSIINNRIAAGMSLHAFETGIVDNYTIKGNAAGSPASVAGTPGVAGWDEAAIYQQLGIP